MKPVKPFNERKHKRHLYWWSDEGWVPYKYGLHASHTIENQKMSNDPNDDNYQPAWGAHLGPPKPAAGAATARPSTPVDSGLLDKSIRTVQREVAGAIWPVWNFYDIEHHPRKDELMRQYPMCFDSISDIEVFPDLTAQTAGKPTERYFRHLRDRQIRGERRTMMILRQMFEVLIEEISLLKSELRRPSTWSDTTWQIEK